MLNDREKYESDYWESVQKKTGTAAFVLLLLFLIIFTYCKPALPLFIV